MGERGTGHPVVINRREGERRLRWRRWNRLLVNGRWLFSCYFCLMALLLGRLPTKQRLALFVLQDPGRFQHKPMHSNMECSPLQGHACIRAGIKHFQSLHFWANTAEPQRLAKRRGSCCFFIKMLRTSKDYQVYKPLNSYKYICYHAETPFNSLLTGSHESTSFYLCKR